MKKTKTFSSRGTGSASSRSTIAHDAVHDFRLGDQGYSGRRLCRARGRARNHRQVPHVLFIFRAKKLFFKGIIKLAPGHYLSLRNGSRKSASIGTWISPSLQESPASSEAEEALFDLLAETVELHMIADVPVGVLLSGGVDSTASAQFCRRKNGQGGQQLHGGFSRQVFADERPYARLAAETYGTSTMK